MLFSLIVVIQVKEGKCFKIQENAFMILKSVLPLCSTARIAQVPFHRACCQNEASSFTQGRLNAMYTPSALTKTSIKFLHQHI